jgi:lipopolysaccharide export system protein LptC
LTFSPLTGARPSSATAGIRRQARAHSRLVLLMRWLLPTLILAMLGLLGAFVVGEAVRAAASRPKELPTQIRMISPHFIGRDNQGRAFNLTSRVAVRDDADMQRVHLTAPVMMLDVDSDHPKTLTADHGVYDEDTRMLRLDGHVRVDDSTNSTAGTNEALVDTRAGTVTGDSAVSAMGPMGQIHGNSYTANQKNDVIVMHGGVHAVIKGH